MIQDKYKIETNTEEKAQEKVDQIMNTQTKILAELAHVTQQLELLQKKNSIAQNNATSIYATPSHNATTVVVESASAVPPLPGAL